MHPNAPAAEPRSTRIRRRVLWIVVGLLLVVFAVPVAWLLSHAFDHSARFTARRGPIVSVEGLESATMADGYISEAISVTAATGLRVDFRVLRPAAAAAPLPLVVLLGGHRTGRNAVDLIGDPQGIILAALDYPYHGPERLRGVVQVVGSVPAIQRGLLDTPPAVSIALEWLLGQAWVDPARVELMGVSLGVPFAAVAGALDDRFRRVWLIHGGVDNRAWLANRLETKIRNHHLREPAATLLHLLAYGSSFRTERWAARIAPRSVVIVGATEDEQMPPANVRELHAAVGEPKELLWTEGRHVGPRRPETIRQVLALIRSRIHERDLAPRAGVVSP